MAGSSLTFILEETTAVDTKYYLQCFLSVDHVGLRVSVSKPGRNYQKTHFQHLGTTLSLLVLFSVTDFAFFSFKMNTSAYHDLRYSTEEVYLFCTESDIFSRIVHLHLTWLHPCIRNYLECWVGKLCNCFSCCILHLIWLLPCVHLTQCSVFEVCVVGFAVRLVAILRLFTSFGEVGPYNSSHGKVLRALFFFLL